MKFKLSAACGCNTGKRRRNNEDNLYFNGQILAEGNNGLPGILVQSCLLEQSPVDFCVFDGMGGHADGQDASRMAASIFEKEHLNDTNGDMPEFMSNLAIRMSEAVWQKADEEFTNMGTTASMLRFRGEEYCVCNVGDSPIFLFSDGELHEIFEEHTEKKFQEMVGQQHGKAGLTQYIGVSPEELTIEPYAAVGELRLGDQFLICSDGLTDMVPQETIAGILSKNVTPDGKVEQLIQAALDGGGRDNITVILINVLGTELPANCNPVKKKKFLGIWDRNRCNHSDSCNNHRDGGIKSESKQECNNGGGYSCD